MAELKGRWELQYWLSFDDGSTYHQVTEDTAFDPETEDQEYSPAYKFQKTQPKYVTGRTLTYTFDIDIKLPQDLQAKLLEIEDDINVPVHVVRTLNFDPASGAAADPASLTAKHATGVLNMKPLDGGASEFLKGTGTVVLDSEFDHGTFNEPTKTYSPTPAPEPGA